MNEQFYLQWLCFTLFWFHGIMVSTKHTVPIGEKRDLNESTKTDIRKKFYHHRRLRREISASHQGCRDHVSVQGAQDEDGYLNTYYTIKDRDKRWTNLLEGHELYCAGHMMEAAVAYYEATGKDRLLKVMLKNAECIYHYFVTEGHAGYPGHPEVELALLRMYRALCEDFSESFLRGNGLLGKGMELCERTVREECKA